MYAPLYHKLIFLITLTQSAIMILFSDMTRLSKRAKKRMHGLLIDGIVVFFVAGLVLGGFMLLWVSTLEIPDLSSFEERRVLQSTKIYDRTGKILLYDLHQDVKRTIVPFEEISRHIKNATVAIEDDTFFEHSGVRPFAILRSMLANMQNGGGPFSGAGGSTITQQVIKNSVLIPEKTLTRKVKEAILALKLERELSKEEILSHYLNESPYGGTIYGVEEASLAFFGKPASDVTLPEAAYLAALPQAPTYYSPYGRNKEALEERKNLVLDRMLLNGFITEEEHTSAVGAQIEFKTQSATGIRAPHFVFYIRDYLARKYGEESLAERGFRVITSLDWELQEKAEEVVKKFALSNEEIFNAENGALVATDPKTGEILVMVGSRDYFDEEIDGNFNIAVAERQPGSSFKPFVYAAAFEKGYTPETVVFDLKTQFSTACAPSKLVTDDTCYSPTNYDDKFRGPITLKNALAQSINVPAVKTLYLAGLTNSIKLARDMGISGLSGGDRYGLTLVLGGGEVQLVDMVNAYGTFANEGEKNDLMSILRIEDATGHTIEENSSSPQRVLDRQTALKISDILSDNVARTPLYGPSSLLYFPGRDVAVKTGTTNDYRDAWIVGYTPTLSVGAWAGNNDNRSMEHKISGLIITPMWREFMDFALEKRPESFFPEPDALPKNIKPVLQGVWFDLGSALSDEDATPDLSINTTLSSAHSILFFVDKDNPQGPYPSNPDRDSQFNLWEYPVSVWKSSILGAVNPEDDKDTETDSD